MLIRFTVSNFLSFKDETEFNMLTGDVKRHPHHVYKREHIDVLRAAAIYGANGAGKSNLIKAIQFLSLIIEGDDVLKKSPKFGLSKDCINKPSELEIEVEINGTTYAYGVVFDSTRIREEWLYKVNFEKDDEMIFERETDENFKHHLKLADKYLQTDKGKYYVEFYQETLINADFTFCSSIYKTNAIEEVNILFNWFREGLIIILPDTKIESLIRDIYLSKDYSEWFNNILKTLDTGVDNLRIQNIKPIFPSNEFDDIHEEIQKILVDNPTVLTTFQHGNNYFGAILENEQIIYKTLVSEHKGNDNQPVAFMLSQESDGTQRLLDFIPIINQLEKAETTFIIDEIDRSIHPSLLKVFLKLLMETRASKGQIIFTTHESSLLDLDIFRQDEIWFAEKNQEGATQFYPLSEFKIRYDLDIRKGYLNGRFGAIPFLENLEKLNQNSHAEKE
jgi:uncharacterized protein